MNLDRRALLLAAAAGAPVVAARTERLRVVAGEYPPYVGSHLPGQGVIAELLRAAAARGGWQLDLRFMPWNRCEAAVESGQADASGPWGRTTERNARFLFSDRLSQFDWVWLARRAAGFDGKLPQLRRQRIALVRSYTYTPQLWAAVRAGELQSQFVASDRVGLSLLARGQIDLLPIDRHTACQMAVAQLSRTDQLALQLHEGPLLGGYSVHLLFARSEAGARHVARFNRGLRDVLADGLHDRLLAGLQCPLTLSGSR